MHFNFLHLPTGVLFIFEWEVVLLRTAVGGVCVDRHFEKLNGIITAVAAAAALLHFISYTLYYIIWSSSVRKTITGFPRQFEQKKVSHARTQIHVAFVEECTFVSQLVFSYTRKGCTVAVWYFDVAVTVDQRADGMSSKLQALPVL